MSNADASHSTNESRTYAVGAWYFKKKKKLLSLFSFSELDSFIDDALHATHTLNCRSGCPVETIQKRSLFIIFKILRLKRSKKPEMKR